VEIPVAGQLVRPPRHGQAQGHGHLAAVGVLPLQPHRLLHVAVIPRGQPTHGDGIIPAPIVRRRPDREAIEGDSLGFQPQVRYPTPKPPAP